MAKLNIVEFSGERETMPPLAIQNVTADAVTAQQSAVFNAGTKRVRLCADAAGWVLFGSNPTATASNAMRVGADDPECFELKGADQRLSFIAAA